MILFFSRNVKEAIRQTKEEERTIAHSERLALLAEMSVISDRNAKDIIKRKDEEKRIALAEKDEEIKALRAIITEKTSIFNKFRRDVENMEILASEMSSLGISIENITGGLTGKFHGFATRIHLIKKSVDKKENKYRSLIEQ